LWNQNPGCPYGKEPGFQLKPDGFQTLHQAICKKASFADRKKIMGVTHWFYLITRGAIILSNFVRLQKL
jgi:hypothetical protein